MTPSHVAAATGTALAVHSAGAGAAFAIRTADALHSAFSGVPEVHGHESDDGDYNCYNDKIRNVHIIHSMHTRQTYFSRL